MKETLGERVKQARELRGWTQEELAKKTGLHFSAISRLESGGRIPTIKNLTRVCEALSVTGDWLLGLTEWSAKYPPADDIPRTQCPQCCGHGVVSIGKELGDLWRVIRRTAAPVVSEQLPAAGIGATGLNNRLAKLEKLGLIRRVGKRGKLVLWLAVQGKEVP